LINVSFTRLLHVCSSVVVGFRSKMTVLDVSLFRLSIDIMIDHICG